MAIRKIARLGEPVLRRVSQPVPEAQIHLPPLQQLIDDMIETMRDADGAGLAAPQVYEPLRICVVEIARNVRYPAFPPMPLSVFINPVVEPQVRDPQSLTDSDAIAMFEGCLSVPDMRGRVRRPRKVRVQALDRSGRPFEIQLEGVLAAVIQHELDHLDGVLFVDRVEPRSLTFLKEYERYVPIAERIRDRGGEEAADAEHR